LATIKVGLDTKPSGAEIIDVATDAAVIASQNPWFEKLAKLGFYSKGFLFIVIGAIAIAVVVGVRGSKLLDQYGALAAIAEEPYGKILLGIFVVGAVGHGTWNIVRAVADIDGLGRKWFAIVQRVVGAGIGIFYLGLAVSALEIVLAARAGDGPSQAEETFVGILLFVPVIGALLAMIIGVGLIGGGFAQCYIGVTGQFQRPYRTWQIRGIHRGVITVLGWISFTVRAVLLVVIGWFFVKAAFYNKPGPIGLDAALLALLESTHGRVLVTIAGVGLISHGILAFYESKYRRIS
jgi:hypothetical protein